MLEQELAFANELADHADEISMRWYRGTDLQVRQKADLSPVTQADVEVEAMVRAALAERFPDDAVLGEEEGLRGEGRRVWIVDPIDGTKNFADGVPVWATLIALAVDGRPELGLVSAPALRERYAATRGGGATFNDEPIHVSSAAQLERAFVCFTELREWLDGPLWDPLVGLVRGARRTRGLGDFWGHLLVARGSVDVMLEPELAIWDYAAAWVIVEEAGGRVSTFEGGEPTPGGSLLTTNGLLHDEVVARLRA